MSSMGQADLRFRKHIPACTFSFVQTIETSSLG